MRARFVPCLVALERDCLGCVLSFRRCNPNPGRVNGRNSAVLPITPYTYGYQHCEGDCRAHAVASIHHCVVVVFNTATSTANPLLHPDDDNELVSSLLSNLSPYLVKPCWHWVQTQVFVNYRARRAEIAGVMKPDMPMLGKRWQVTSFCSRCHARRRWPFSLRSALPKSRSSQHTLVYHDECVTSPVTLQYSLSCAVLIFARLLSWFPFAVAAHLSVSLNMPDFASNGSLNPPPTSPTWLPD